jgi:hypothetical protein
MNKDESPGLNHKSNGSEWKDFLLEEDRGIDHGTQSKKEPPKSAALWN